MSHSKYMLSCDPGKNHCGFALWNSSSKRLVSAELVKTPDLRSRVTLWAGVDTLVIEKPIRRAREQFKMDDLISVAIVVGQVVALVNAPEVVYWAPHEWKGSLSKEVHHERVQRVLSKEEMARITMPRAVKTLGHNVWDSVGIGLRWLGRL